MAGNALVEFLDKVAGGRHAVVGVASAALWTCALGRRVVVQFLTGRGL